MRPDSFPGGGRGGWSLADGVQWGGWITCRAGEAAGGAVLRVWGGAAAGGEELRRRSSSRPQQPSADRGMWLHEGMLGGRGGSGPDMIELAG
jgi:hypothetical protein